MAYSRDMYSTSAGPDLGFVFLAIVFGVLNLWATIVVIVAGHRYLKRTAAKPGARDQSKP